MPLPLMLYRDPEKMNKKSFTKHRIGRKKEKKNKTQNQHHKAYWLLIKVITLLPPLKVAFLLQFHQ